VESESIAWEAAIESGGLLQAHVTVDGPGAFNIP